MSTKTQKEQEWALASVGLQDAFTDFVLSRQAMLCSPATVKWYSWTLTKFLDFFQIQGITTPFDISARQVRQYLGELAGRELSDSYVHGHARAIRTFLRFCFVEDYLDRKVEFKMPSIGEKRLPVLDARDLKRLLEVGEKPRDYALVAFMVDTGVRRAELLALNWGDINIENGVVLIAKGKGKKARSVVGLGKTGEVGPFHLLGTSVGIFARGGN